ncbi:hypothetical protein QE429_003864 [Bacillus sp. SORGH_AS 510]|uniref:hypothetical protein n=1 Tax=Bacillus sp. SORGH_AS_0510 TaxID=3041771 RepID=UPI002784764E|nr:hypothetical protein [Bacillus sp. SORGH_AS_0510]MDQ1147037.1 hypothetical protein [Bacillus sp. SORGH_AS_0510]
MNLGERHEYWLKFMLIELRDGRVKIPCPIRVESVGFGNIEYPSLPRGLDIKTIVGYSDEQLINTAEGLGITKAPSLSKSDVQINGIGYSVKSQGSNPPALLNHTRRPGVEFACNYAGVNIKELDPLVEKYWWLRENGIIGEDVRNSSNESPFRDHRDTLGEVLKYFIFTGTGARGLSKHPAEFILEFANPLNPETWTIINKDDAIDKLWDKLIISIRSKQMPNNYPYNKDQNENESIAMWTRFIDGQYRGSLHIRNS